FDVNERQGPFGSFGYTVYDCHVVRGQKVLLPVLTISLDNGSLEAAEAVFQAHQSALLQGKSSSSVRFWKRKGDGQMSEADYARGYSDGGYPLLGVMTWDVLQSARLPAWAMPHYLTGFSLENLPRHWDAKQLVSRDRIAARVAKALGQF